MNDNKPLFQLSFSAYKL